MPYVELGEFEVFKSTHVSHLNGNLTLSKDQSARIKASILCMRHNLLTAVNHDTVLNLSCDCGVCFLNTPIARIVKKHDRPKNLASIKVRFVWGEFTGCVENMVIVGWSIEIQSTWMIRPSTVEIGLCWYKKRNQQ